MTRIGKTKRSTDSIIDGAIDRQNNWMSRRSRMARKFLKNMFALRKEPETRNQKSGVMRDYWFPILCLIAIIMIAVWVLLRGCCNIAPAALAPDVPEPVVKIVNDSSDKSPAFDIVRIDPNGTVVVAGKWRANAKISVLVNGEIVATERTDGDGEFVYAPTKIWMPGNYTISLVDAENGTESENKVFVYISEHGARNSISLLMTDKGGKLMQSPDLADGDLVVAKIDYLNTGRLVVTGNALPRLRVSLSLDGRNLGSARVSDHRNFGIGADAGELEPGRTYSLIVRLHDGEGKRVARVAHTFVMPAATGSRDTFYTVRRGDCLWIIARNFLRRGVLFSIIADANKIENPDLIFSRQKLLIPVE